MEKYDFTGKILIVGFGSIGQGVLPLILRHFTITPDRIAIVTKDNRGEAEAREYGVAFHREPLLKENYEAILATYVQKGDFIVNVSVDVSSAAVIEYCQKNGILYIDTVMEPWLGFYIDPTLSVSDRSNYALRETALKLRALAVEGERPTAVLAHGANPGLVSHFVKQALLNIATDTGEAVATPATQAEWAALAHKLGIKVIHIAERDTQNSVTPRKMGEFVNTWSIDGFASEGCQPAEMGWGTHEKTLPEKARTHNFGCQSAIYLDQPGFETKVRSWTPISRAQHAWVITHHESIAIADYFTVKGADGEAVYRPTVHYAYHPCDGAVLSLDELAARNGEFLEEQRLITDEILDGGVDELGVLLMGHKKGAYWFGSRLSIDETRKLVPHHNATGLQVTASMIGAMVWAMEHPTQGIVDAEELDHKTVLTVAAPYLGKVFGEYTDWTPIEGRGKLFPEQFDSEDPWQFSNFQIS